MRYRGEASVMYLQFPDITIKNIKKYLNDDIKYNKIFSYFTCI